MRELSVAEQKYQAILAVISDGLSVSQVASKVGVSRQTVHAWLARYEAEGLEGLADRSHRPVSCPHQIPAVVEAAVVELRRSRPYWGPRRLVFELGRRGVEPVPSESAVYRALVRATKPQVTGHSPDTGLRARCRHDDSAPATAGAPRRPPPGRSIRSCRTARARSMARHWARRCRSCRHPRTG